MAPVYQRRTTRGRCGEEKVANACDWFPNLTPVSEAPAGHIRGNFEALLPGQEIPLIGEPAPDDDDPYC